LTQFSVGIPYVYQRVRYVLVFHFFRFTITNCQPHAGLVLTAVGPRRRPWTVEARWRVIFLFLIYRDGFWCPQLCVHPSFLRFTLRDGQFWAAFWPQAILRTWFLKISSSY